MNFCNKESEKWYTQEHMKYEKLLQQAQKRDYDLGICVRIVHEGKILLLKRAIKDTYAGIWEMPGGGVEKGEDPVVALVREIFEETALKIKLTDLAFVDYFEFHNIEKNMHKRKFCFHIVINKPIIKISHEHQNFKLFKQEDFLQLISSSEDPKNYQIWDDHYQLVFKFF